MVTSNSLHAELALAPEVVIPSTVTVSRRRADPSMYINSSARVADSAFWFITKKIKLVHYYY